MNRPLVYLWALAAVTLIVCSCKEDDILLKEEAPEASADPSIVKSNMLQDEWIYSVMRKNYLWADDLKDSLEYDFTLAPDKFFESMIVPHDRFSYCYLNTDYYGPTKGSELNATISLDTVYVVNGRRIGYLYYTEFETEADVTDAVLKIRPVDELIIDLRRNPGGSVQTCIYFASVIAPHSVEGEEFCSYRFNSSIAAENMINTGDECTYSYFMSGNLIRNRSLNLSRVFFLTGENSASCSELIINCLRPYMQVITIGETTRGKDVGMRVQKNDHCKYVLVPITFRTYNVEGIPVPESGIVPDIPVENTNPSKIGNMEEPLLKAALQIIKNNKHISHENA